MNTPPLQPCSPVFFSPESSPVDSAQEQDDMAEQIAALPSPEVHRQVSLTDDKKALLKKTLDEYQVSSLQAVEHPLASVVGTISGSATALSYAMWTPIPFTSWHIPVLPLLSLKLGVTRTLGLSIAIIAGGGFYGWCKAASEIYQKTPEDNLAEKITRLREERSIYIDQILAARLELLRAECKWSQLVPQLDIGGRKRVRDEIESYLSMCTEMTMPPVTRFYEKEVQKQESVIQELDERVALLQQRINEGQDAKLEWLRTLFDLEKENAALKSLNELLESAKATSVQDFAGHLDNLGQVEFGLSDECKLQVTIETYNKYLKANSKLDNLQAQYIEKRAELVKILVDDQRVRLARDQGMTTEKKEKGACK